MMRSLALGFFMLCATLTYAQNELTVELNLNRPTAGGTLRMVLCPSADAFNNEKGCTVKQATATGDVVRVVFNNLPNGTYAIKVFHDVNDNGVLDTNWLGIPTEPYGFSKDAMGTFGPPSFQQASFTVKPGANTTRIRMKG